MPLKLQNTIYTLNRCGLYLGTNFLSMYDNGRGEEEETTKEFLLNDKQLSLKGECCRNFSRVFFWIAYQ